MQTDLSSILVPEKILSWLSSELGSLHEPLFNNTAVLFSQMTTSIAIEDVRREVKILKALAGNKNLVQFYDAYEDNDNVYIVME